MTTQDNNLLLSLSVFKKLYDEDLDIYEIIVLFIKQEISSQITPFSLTEVTHTINDNYGFDIPQAVIKVSLNKIKKEGLLEQDHGNYKVISKITVNNIKEDSLLAKKQKQSVLDEIKKYLDNKDISYDDVEKSLENYILNKPDNITTHIDACIIKQSTSNEFITALNEIKYGLVLYQGITYGIENINPERWREKTIFLDTEILFYLGGYQGELFKRIANDFFSLVKIANKKKKIITLRFLESTKKQIDDMFYVSELIIKRQKAYEPNDVIRHILDNCKNGSASDVVNKKTEFYNFLSKVGIKLYKENIDYNNQKNQKFNLSNDNSSSDDKDKIRIEQLNIINILRSGSDADSLYQVNFLLVTRTNNTIKFSIEHKQENNGFPLALRLSDITNQLWIKTNKGLGNQKDLPATFDIRNKAKIALSRSLMKKVSEEHESIVKDSKNIDKNLIIDKVSELKKYELSPDDINEENCEKIESIIINPEELQKHYEEKSMYKHDVKDKAKIIIQKDIELSDKDNQIKNLEKKIVVENKNNIINKIKLAIFIILLFVFWNYQEFFIEKISFINSLVIKTLAILGSIFTILSFFGLSFNNIKSRFTRKNE